MPKQFTPPIELSQLPPKVIARFWANVRKTDSCWLWKGWVPPNGYGVVRWGSGRKADIERGISGRVFAHRMAYMLCVGPIPAGHEIDHVRARGCTNRHCVNPAHLEAVTPRVNTLRGSSLAAQRAQQTHCLRGHRLDEANVYVTARGQRYCKACRRLEMAARRSRLREAIACGEAPVRQAPKVKQCKHGHEYTQENIGYFVGGFRCLTCHRERKRARRAS